MKIVKSLCALLFAYFFFNFNYSAAAQDSMSFAPSEQIQTSSEEQDLPSESDADQEELQSDVPYWVAQPSENERPYWLPDPNSPPPIDPGASPQSDRSLDGDAESSAEEPKSGLFAPPEPPAAAAPEPAMEAPEPQKAETIIVEDGVEEISYYMFKDEHGVTHLTDAPTDPRYRLFTIKVTVSSGQAPFRHLNIDSVKPFILKASNTYKVDPALIAAIIKAESNFDPKAISWVGARGLMQLMPNTAKLVGCQDSFDPEQNIMGGTRYIRMMLNRFNGNVTLALAAYNSGPERVSKIMAVPEISETKNYVRTVVKNYEAFMKMFEAEREQEQIQDQNQEQEQSQNQEQVQD
ncbi:MAG: lytic transglycosylase domain-containing protein [Deltaproteobacteria bacterium]|jgi:hypothetical protein|nr:lytic transglycosylase domain-containing protein [Deltaproteobacteria bacterium]